MTEIERELEKELGFRLETGGAIGHTIYTWDAMHLRRASTEFELKLWQALIAAKTELKLVIKRTGYKELCR